MFRETRQSEVLNSWLSPGITVQPKASSQSTIAKAVFVCLSVCQLVQSEAIRGELRHKASEKKPTVEPLVYTRHNSF